MDLHLMFVVTLVIIVNFNYCFGGSEPKSGQQFPSDFVWGAASSSYQVEGGWNVDGKGPSVWDNITHSQPERIKDHTNGDVAANSYEFYKEDVKALKMVGFKYYRFSISWPRVLPTGDVHNINELGLKYYDNLINELLANDIKPIVTIFHWEMPQTLQDIGGMLTPKIINFFFTTQLFCFNVSVKLWNTFNEPNIMCELGYGAMYHAPFVDTPGVGPYLCSYHILIANASIYRMYHEKFNQDKEGKIGIVLHSNFFWPKDKKKGEDIIAADRAQQFWLGWFAKPIFNGDGYPKIMVDTIQANSRSEKLPKSRLPVISESDKLLIQGSADFFFLNYYTSEFAEKATKPNPKWRTPSFERDQNVILSADKNLPVAASPWLRDAPKGLRDLLNYIRQTYGNPGIIITENGWSDHGEINDSGREKYIRGHLQAVLDAIGDGCRVYGQLFNNSHISWSLIDNFEWTSGYTEQFGLFQVDYKSPKRTRTPKNSVKLMRKIIETGKIPNN